MTKLEGIIETRMPKELSIVNSNLVPRHCFVIRHFLTVIALARSDVFAFVTTMAEMTQLTWYGHAAFKLIAPSGHVLLIDPWLTNPVYDKGKDELGGLKRVDLIFLTHGHSDHVGDAVEIG